MSTPKPSPESDSGTNPAGKSRANGTPVTRTPSTPQIRTTNKAGLQNSVLGTRNLMTLAALGVIGGLISLPLAFLEDTWMLSPKLIFFGGFIMMILYTFVFLLPCVIVPKPGALIVAAFVIAIINLFGPKVTVGFVGTLFGAVVIGLPLVLMYWQWWTWWAYQICAVFFGIVMGFGMAAAVDPSTKHAILTGADVFYIVVISVVGAIIGAWLAMLVRKALARTGIVVEPSSPRLPGFLGGNRKRGQRASTGSAGKTRR